MAQGKAVIGTYGASFEQLIKNKENGLLIQRDSVKALVRAVGYLMAMSEQERWEMGMRAKETVTRLSPENIYEQVMKYYRNVIKNFSNKGHLLR